MPQQLSEIPGVAGETRGGKADAEECAAGQRDHMEQAVAAEELAEQTIWIQEEKISGREVII